MEIVEELLLAEEMIASSFQAFTYRGFLGHETDIIDGANVEHGGG